MQRHSFTALNSTFVVDSEYQFVKELGQGAYGCVVAARHRRSGEGCAIKKITNINTKVKVDGGKCISLPSLKSNHISLAYSHQTMLEGDQVCPDQSVGFSITEVNSDSCIISAVTKMSVRNFEL